SADSATPSIAGPGSLADCEKTRTASSISKAVDLQAVAHHQESSPAFGLCGGNHRPRKLRRLAPLPALKGSPNRSLCRASLLDRCRGLGWFAERPARPDCIPRRMPLFEWFLAAAAPS